MDWWREFFDETYFKLWSPLHPPEQCEEEAQALVRVLGLPSQARVLDAPCGYGRMSLPLARRGYRVTALDLSETLLALARERASDETSSHAIDFVRADLREAKLPPSFDAAINLFSSIGYSSEEDDLRMMRSIFDALVPGGKLYLDTMHRDALVTRRALDEVPGLRGPGGITMREKNAFDPTTGRIHSTWTWNSPTHSGSRTSDMRIYSATELVSMMRQVGFASVECRVGISEQQFSEDTLGERLGLLCTKGI